MNDISIIEKEGQRNNNNLNLKNVKDKFTNTVDKRSFIFEKIEKDVRNFKNHFKQIKSNSMDERLLNLRKNLKKKVKKKDFLKKNNIYASKNIDHIYRFIKKQNNFKLKSIKNKFNIIPAKRIITRHTSDINLPPINNRKKIKEFLLKNSHLTTLPLFTKNSYLENKEIVSNSVLLCHNDFNLNQPRMIKIRSFSNISKDNDLSNNKETKECNINEIDAKYNLDLNSKIKYKKKNSIFHGKKYTMFGMLNKLFEYYSSETNNAISSNVENQSSNYINYSKSNNSLLQVQNINQENDKDNNNDNINNNNNDISKINDDVNFFLTKIENKFDKEDNDNKFSVTKFISNRFSIGDIIKRNKKIIEENKKVTIDCLLSKIERNISIKKILYKYLDKTIYEIENDKSYTRLKEFEKKIFAILKNIE